MKLKEVIEGKGAAESDLHRTKKKALERPETQVDLMSVSVECKQVTKTQKDPTEDLVELQNGQSAIPLDATSGYLVWCEDTAQMWYAHDEVCLNKNFIYRDDLLIHEILSKEAAQNFYAEHAAKCNPGIISNKVCYILDNPCNETYEVYKDSNYPAQHYGKATPQGCFVHRYQNRFHRDMAILELDSLYSNSSTKEAGKFLSRPFEHNEAIVVSDGAWMKETSTYSFFYLDEFSCMKQTCGFAPSEEDQAVLIAEICGAHNALKMCVANKKSKIKYYYDNTSIVNVFKNRKTEYIEEIKQYKEYLIRLDKMGYDIEFIELHPKNSDDKDAQNKALMLFHNTCDNECRAMSDLVAKNYKGHAKYDNSAGKKAKDFVNPPKKQNNNRGGYRR